MNRLMSIWLIAMGTALVGCSHLSEPDLEAIIASHCKVVHCPSTARHFDLGLAPIRECVSAETQGIFDSLAVPDLAQERIET